MTTDKHIEEKLGEFRQALREQYEGILPEEVLAKGNPWFENFITQTIKETEERVRAEYNKPRT